MPHRFVRSVDLEFLAEALAGIIDSAEAPLGDFFTKSLLGRGGKLRGSTSFGVGTSANSLDVLIAE